MSRSEAMAKILARPHDQRLLDYLDGMSDAEFWRWFARNMQPEKAEDYADGPML